jgi:ribosomal protein S18 acetylase RimI-like enzyme
MVCTMNDRCLGIITRENKKSYTYGNRRYAPKTTQGKDWKLCRFRFHQSTSLSLNIHHRLNKLMLDCFPDDHSQEDSSWFYSPAHHFWIQNDKKEIIAYMRYDGETLWNICTAFPYRRKGFMNLLLDYFFSVIPQRPIYLYVLKKNKVARRAYTRYGFRTVGQEWDTLRMSFS